VRDAFDPRKTFRPGRRGVSEHLEVATCGQPSARRAAPVHGARRLLRHRRGETVALVGESGSGKSVTALSILQLLPYPLARHPRRQHPLRRQELLGAPERACAASAATASP
jgi:microcin C transport system ATP-binding protein